MKLSVWGAFDILENNVGVMYDIIIRYAYRRIAV